MSAWAQAAGLLAAAVLGAGCASAPLESVLAGRLSLRVEAAGARAATSFSAAFELRGGAQRGDLRLLSPLGTQWAQVRWSPAAVSLLTADGESHFATLDDLSLSALGEQVPLVALPDWLAGRPWAGAPALARADGFQQLGWSVDLSGHAQGRLLAQRSAAPAVTLRVVLDEAPS